MLIKAEKSSLLVIDIQQRLAPAMANAERVVANTTVLMKAAARLGVPVLASEQYPRGLGSTIGELAPMIPAENCLEKIDFSCMADEAYCSKFKSLGRPQAIVVGIEAHVCVLQTVMDLLEEGFAPFVVADAVSSRTEENEVRALDRMRHAGASIVATEMVVFEWLRRAGTPAFKEISALIK